MLRLWGNAAGACRCRLCCSHSSANPCGNRYQLSSLMCRFCGIISCAVPLNASHVLGTHDNHRARLGVSTSTYSVAVQGIAAALVEAGAAHACGAGVQQLYVHVIAANAAGVGLYAVRGFEQEQAESEAAARALGRPARLLLRRSLGGGDY